MSFAVFGLFAPRRIAAGGASRWGWYLGQGRTPACPSGRQAHEGHRGEESNEEDDDGNVSG